MPGVLLLSRNSLEHAVAGSAGTVLATLLLFPLERLKTLLQIESGDGTFREVLRRVLQDDGPKGLYRGCTPMLQTVGTSNFLYFFLFEGLKEPLARAMGRADGIAGIYESLASSALAGALNMVITEPLWRASTVAQAANSPSPAMSNGAGGSSSSSSARVPEGVFGTVHRMWAAEGARALWRGLGSSLWLVSNPVIQFFAYDWLKALRWSSNDISTLEAFFLGALAKALATVLTFPLQVAQSRLRLAPAGDALRPELGGMVACLRAVYKEKGLRGLYFGIFPKLLQSVSQAAFMFAFYEKVHWAIRRLSRQGVRKLAGRAQRLR